MIVEPTYRGFRIEVGASAPGMVYWNAHVRILASSAARSHAASSRPRNSRRGEAPRNSIGPDRISWRSAFERGPLCAACISTKSGLAVGDIEPTARQCEQTIAVKRDMGQCKACERWTLVYSLFGVQRRA